MTLVNIDLRNQGYETGPDDRVIFYSLLVREGDFGTISTAPVEVELVDGKATVDLAPGPVGVQIIARQVADTRIKIGEVPPSGPTTLGAVMMVTPAYTPALQKMMIAAIERAKEIAVGQVDGAVSIAIDAEVGEAIYTATSSAVSAANSATVAQQSASSAEARAASAESGATNAVSRVAALEAMSGLSPESPADGQTANLVEQPNTLTRQSLNAAIQSGMNAVSVKNFGAKGDGTTDDTAAIQAAIDWVADLGGGEVIVPGGVYMVKAHSDTFTGTTFMRDTGGIALKDNVHLRMSQGATLRAIPNDMRAYEIVRIFDKKNVTVSGGTIQGDRDLHDGATDGEWGYGIAVTGGENITLTDLTARDCWGDGINIQAMNAPVGTIPEVPQNVIISRVTSTGNRRQGMSVEAVIGLHVSDSIFEKTGGKPPQAGVDIEPYNNYSPIENMVFSRCIFRANATWGLLAMMPQLDGLTVEDCLFEDNESTQAQLEIFSAGTRFTMSRNTFRGTPIGTPSIHVRATSNIVVSENACDNHIRIEKMEASPDVSDVYVKDNLVSITAGLQRGVTVRHGNRVSISGNTIQGNNMPQSTGIAIGGSRGVTINGNRILNAGTGIAMSRDYTEKDCEDLVISQNFIADSITATIAINQTRGCLFGENTVWGSSHGNNGGHTIYSGGGTVSEVRIIGNAFHREPYGADAGTGRSNFVLSITTMPDTIAEKNIIHGEGYALWSKTAAPTSGYMGEEMGIMAVPSSRFPTVPKLGMMVLDTGSGVVSMWNGSVWTPMSGGAAGV